MPNYHVFGMRPLQKKVKKILYGMKQTFISLLMNKPKYLILDEPPWYDPDEH